MRDLDHIAARKGKMIHLRELLLGGNPVRDTEYQHNRGEQYRLCVDLTYRILGADQWILSEMARRFTTLELLDQEPIMKISFDVPEAAASSSSTPVPVNKSTTFPLPMGGSFITGVDGVLINNFLMRYAFRLSDFSDILMLPSQLLPHVRQPAGWVNRRIRRRVLLLLFCQRHYSYPRTYTRPTLQDGQQQEARLEQLVHGRRRWIKKS